MPTVTVIANEMDASAADPSEESRRWGPLGTVGIMPTIHSTFSCQENESSLNLEGKKWTCRSKKNLYKDGFIEMNISTFIFIYIYVLVAQSCPTLCDPMVCSLLGFSVHGILQARTLECIAIPFSYMYIYI